MTLNQDQHTIKLLLKLDQPKPFYEPGPLTKFKLGERIEWRLPNGIRHREGGPAEEYCNGVNVWYSYGLKHREDGPAITYPNGKKNFYKNGVEFTYYQYHRYHLKQSEIRSLIGSLIYSVRTLFSHGN